MELWIYGIKDSETELLTAIQSITNNYKVMPSIVYGAIEYRVFVADNSELQTLINSINNITGVMFTHERFTGLGLALNPDGTPFGTKVNPDGTPWSEIGYMTDLIIAPNKYIYTVDTWYDIYEWETLFVMWTGSKFSIDPDGAPITSIYIGVHVNDKPIEGYTLQHIVTNFTEEGDWYVFYKGNFYIDYGLSGDKRSDNFKLCVKRVTPSGSNVKVYNQTYKWRQL
jgi:hypothetical protein